MYWYKRSGPVQVKFANDGEGTLKQKVTQISLQISAVQSSLQESLCKMKIPQENAVFNAQLTIEPVK